MRALTHSVNCRATTRCYCTWFNGSRNNKRSASSMLPASAISKAFIISDQFKLLQENVKNHVGSPKVLTIEMNSEQHFCQYDADPRVFLIVRCILSTSPCGVCSSWLCHIFHGTDTLDLTRKYPIMDRT